MKKFAILAIFVGFFTLHNVYADEGAVPNENSSGYYITSNETIENNGNQSNANNVNNPAKATTIIEVQSLSFGEIVVGTTPSIVDVQLSGDAIVRSGNAIAIDGMKAGKLQISGRGGSGVSISAPSQIVLTNAQGNELIFEPKLVQNYVYLTDNNSVNNKGYNIDIVGSLHLGANQPSGSYSGNFYLFANY